MVQFARPCQRARPVPVDRNFPIPDHQDATLRVDHGVAAINVHCWPFPQRASRARTPGWSYDAVMRKTLIVALAAACSGGGSGSGVDGNKKLADLTASEANAECNFLFDTYPQVTVSCPDGTSTTKGEDPTRRATECNKGTAGVPAGCTVTIDQFEACVADLYHETDAARCSVSTSPPMSCALSPPVSVGTRSTGINGTQGPTRWRADSSSP